MTLANLFLICTCCCFRFSLFLISKFIYLLIYLFEESPNCNSDIFMVNLFVLAFFCPLLFLCFSFYMIIIIFFWLDIGPSFYYKINCFPSEEKAKKKKRTISSGNLFLFLRFNINFSSRDCLAPFIFLLMMNAVVVGFCVLSYSTQIGVKVCWYINRTLIVLIFQV